MNYFFDFKINEIPFITQLKSCQRLDFQADPNHKFKPFFFDFKIDFNFLL